MSDNKVDIGAEHIKTNSPKNKFKKRGMNETAKRENETVE